MADSEYIAFLNHDDIWLEDHLELAVTALHTGSKNAFLGRAAFCHSKNQPAYRSRLLFSELNRPEELWCSLRGPFSFFEPASTWVVTTALARKVGYWHSPNQVPMTPVMDWVLRLVAADANFAFSQEVSVLKFNLHTPADTKGQNTYHQTAVWIPRLRRYIDHSADQIRKEISSDLVSASKEGLVVREHMDGQPLKLTAKMRKDKAVFLLHQALGLLPRLVRKELRRRTGNQFAKRLIFTRTGEDIRTFPSADQIIEQLQTKNGY